jgi:hypothetical protein
MDNHMASEVNDDDLEYAYHFIQHICTEIGPGHSGTAQEQQRGEYIQQELEQIVDTVVAEEFTCSPATHLEWIKLGVVLVAISAVFYSLSVLGIFPLASAILAALSAGVVFAMNLFQFILYREFVDFLYPTKKSSNIVGTIKSKSATKSILIFSGHHDSALQFTWLRYLKRGYFLVVATLIGSMVIVAAASLLQLTLVLANHTLGVLPTVIMVLLWVLTPAVLAFGFFFAEKGEYGGKVPGAIDNLSAVATTLALARIVKRHPELVADHTEIRIISFGCEEAGCRGSLRYVQAHREELQQHDTACVNFESLCDPTIWIFRTDRNSTVKYPPQFVDEMVAAAQQSGVPFIVKPFPFGGGGTDGLRFAEAGIPSTTLYALRVPEDMVALYHQEFDTYDKINNETLANALKIAVEFLRNRAAWGQASSLPG